MQSSTPSQQVTGESSVHIGSWESRILASTEPLVTYGIGASCLTSHCGLFSNLRNEWAGVHDLKFPFAIAVFGFMIMLPKGAKPVNQVTDLHILGQKLLQVNSLASKGAFTYVDNCFIIFKSLKKIIFLRKFCMYWPLLLLVHLDLCLHVLIILIFLTKI